MIIDTLDKADKYFAMHPAFKQAFEFLRTQPLATLPDGKIVLDGDRLFASVQSPEGRPKAGSSLEWHRKYIDIQYVVSGDETMGWTPLQCLGHPGAFDEKNDCGLAQEQSLAWFPVRPGTFTIFFPEDAHAPNIGTGVHKKVVIKVLV